MADSIKEKQKKSIWAGENISSLRRQLLTVLSIAWPAVVESFFISLTGIIDTFMVSGVGSTAVAAVGITTQPKFLGFALFFAMNISVSALVARRRGENNRREANMTLSTAFILAVGLAVVVGIAFSTYASHIMRLCGSNGDTHDLATAYFRIVMSCMVFNIISMVINAAQRGAGNTRISMRSNLVSSFANITFNYLLIGGHLGFPALGVRGAAIATVLGTVFGACISIISLSKEDSFLSLPFILREKTYQNLTPARSIAKLSVSTFTEQVLMRIGFMSTAIMAADMGTYAMAAHQVGMNCLGLSFSLGDGMQAATVALIGQSLGRNDERQARRYGWISESIGMIFALIMFLVYGFGGRAIFSLFFKEEEVIRMGIGIARILMIVVLFQIIQVIFTGSLRGAGDVFYTMICSTISVTVIRTLVSYIFCYPLKMGLNGIWMGIMADQMSRMIFSGVRFAGGKWTKIKI